MTCRLVRLSSALLVLAWLTAATGRAEVIVAEGEQFRPLDNKGWKVTHQDDSYGSHTYGGMWMTHGGCLGAPADSAGSVAVQTVTVAAAGKFRVWSKYQAPPYFNYLRRIEIVQNGKTVFTHDYGRAGTERLWSFSGESNELWWPWGVDHDAAEAPKQVAELAAGPAEVRLLTIPNAKPAGDRFVDFVVLTTNAADSYDGFKPYAVGSPFANEALAATRLYVRFQNSAASAAQLTVARAGHFQPQYGGATARFPAAAVQAGQWSEWFNVGPFCRLVHDEGLTLTLPGAQEIAVQFARDAAGKELVGDLKVSSGESVVVPLEITWQKDARVKASREHAREIIALSKKWRTANGGKKPKEILFYGAFGGSEGWVTDLKDALGYNTQLPDRYEHVKRDGLHAHVFGIEAIRKFAATLKDKDNFRVLSFGDEIALGEINYADPKLQTKFRAWLKSKGVTKADLGVEPEQAALTKTSSPRLAWYSNLFNEEERFAEYRENTRVAREAIGAHVLTGANYSPHTLALCYGPVYQWVDIFKHNGMGMFWGEDYIFSVPEVPQILSWMFAEVRCGVKYNHQPIHFYIMPHAPGQEPGFLRRNLLLAVGNGTSHVDSFWVAPEERFTENYVAWKYRDTFRTLHEAIYDTAEAEKLLTRGTVRPARVAVVVGKATDFNESRLLVDKGKDPFARNCRNAPDKLNQILCRKEQQMLYLALRHAQHAVDLVTEDDIADGVLKDYDVVYFAGEWIDDRAVRKLDAWVKEGGVLFASGGIGRFNQYGEPEPAMRQLLGLKDSALEKNGVILRTLLELPLYPEIGTITLDGQKIPALGMRQTLVPDTAKVLGTWADGGAAVTVHEHGKGKAFAVGTLAGNVWMKSALKVTPWARGGRHMLYNPVNFDPAATRLVRLGIDAKKAEQAAVCSDPGVEAVVLDHKDGTLLTLVNWTNGPVRGLKVTVKLPAAPKAVRTVAGQKSLPMEFGQGAVTFTTDLDDADFILLPK
jgi:hypothetical protein